MATPRFRLEPDGQHVWWYHRCSSRPDDWPEAAGMLPVTEETILPNATWHIVSRDPLTVTPSILCLECGTHGFITNGEWVSA